MRCTAQRESDAGGSPDKYEDPVKIKYDLEVFSIALI